jgi:hypothetical protein
MEAAVPAEPDAAEETVLDDSEVDLRSPAWTHEALVSAATRTLHGRDPLSFLLRPEDSQPAALKPKPPRKAQGGEGGGARAVAAKATGRLLLEAIAGEARRGETDAAHAFLCALAAFLGPAAEGARLPMFLGREVDLHRLFTAVAAFGGAVGVAACKRAWSAVSDLLHGPVRSPTKSAVHRAAYEALLAGYETHLVAQGGYEAVVEAAKEAFPEAAAEAAARPAEPGAAPAKRQKRGAETRTCKLCGEPGDGRLLPCDFCSAAFHLACLGLDSFPQSKFWKCAACAETDPNDDWCALCSDEGDLLCCDTCPRSFHVVCLGLSEVPPDDQKWQCPSCLGTDADALPLEVVVQQPALLPPSLPEPELPAADMQA